MVEFPHPASFGDGGGLGLQIARLFSIHITEV